MTHATSLDSVSPVGAFSERLQRRGAVCIGLIIVLMMLLPRASGAAAHDSTEDNPRWVSDVSRDLGLPIDKKCQRVRVERIEFKSGGLLIGGTLIDDCTKGSEPATFLIGGSTPPFLQNAKFVPGTFRTWGQAKFGVAFTKALARDPAVAGYSDTFDGAQTTTTVNAQYHPYHAFVWQDPAGIMDIARACDRCGHSSATGANHDGTVATGFVALGFDDTDMNHAFRWTQPDGMVDLGSATGPSGYSRAFGISDDGSAIVGESDFPIEPDALGHSTVRRAFRWTQADGFRDLGELQFRGGSMASAITADGSVIVGNALVGSNYHAVRWGADAGIQDIGTLPGSGRSAAATAVSDNGKVVVGVSATRPLSYSGVLGWDFDPVDTRAFRWTPAHGMQDLTQLFAANGIDVTGITIVAVTGISQDGAFVVGEMTTPTTQSRSPYETTSFVARFCDDASESCAAAATTSN